MESELTALEEDVRKAAQLCQELRDENRDLRRKLSEMEVERRSLGEKIESARTRLEHLLKQIPE
jgi:cell division protein ZapB